MDSACEKQNFILLISPLNTLYTYNFEYIPRNQHSKYHNLLFNDKHPETKLEILPYIENDVFKTYSELNLSKYIFYYADNEEEKNLIQKEHEYLNFSKFFKCQFLLKTELLSDEYKNKFVVFITPNLKEDLNQIKQNENIIRILDIMLYKNTLEFLNYQKELISILSTNKTNFEFYELMIECFRQSNLLIKFCSENLENCSKFRNNIHEKYFSKSINCLYVLDHDSTAKLYRKRELAQTSQLVNYIPFLHYNYFLKDENEFDIFYSNIKVILQRDPYYYLKNKDSYIKNVQNIFDKKEKIIQLHKIDVVETLFDRYGVYSLLYKFTNENKNELLKNINIKLSVPYSIKISIDEKLDNKKNLNNFINQLKNENNIQYPFMLKPNSCTAHGMKLILNEEGLNNIFNDEKNYKDFILENKNFIIQKYINHGGEMIKSYCINGESYSFVRPSMPNVNKENEKQISAKGEISLINELIYNKEKNNFLKDVPVGGEEMKTILKEKFEKTNKTTELFVEKTKITFFGLDFLYDKDKDEFYLLEINYFPSYRELGKELHNKFDQHIIKYYNKYKSN